MKSGHNLPPYKPLVRRGRPSSQFVPCSPSGFAVAWVVIVLTHLVCGVSLFVNAAIAQLTLLPQLAGAVEVFERIGCEWHTPVMVAAELLYLTLGCVHFACAFVTLTRSVKSMALTFKAIEAPTQSRKRTFLYCPEVVSSTWWYKCIISVFGAPRRLFGVRGRYFHAGFITRELLEIAAQVFQGYRNSKYVARGWINQLSVVVLVLNCWSTPLLYWIHHRRRWVSIETTRIWCLAVDVALDLVMVAVIPSLIALPYVRFASGLANSDPNAIANVMNPSTLVQGKAELQTITVTTWLTLLAQAIQLLAILHVLGDIKSLLHKQSLASVRRLKVTVAPMKTQILHPSSSPIRQHQRVTVMTALDVIFVLVGLLIAIVSWRTFAGNSATTATCHLPMHPWNSNRVTCSYVVINCNRLNIEGSALEIRPLLASYDLSELAALSFIHCPALEMPSSIASMPALLTIEVYNSSLVSWDSAAAIRTTTHPWFVQVLMYPVNMDAVGNTLPPGLMADDIPSTLVSLLISDSNMSALSSTFSSKWRHSSVTLVLDRCQLTTIPQVTVTDAISLVGNDQLVEAPSWTLDGPRVVIVNEIPHLVLPATMSSPVKTSLSIQSSRIEKIPDWALTGKMPSIWAWNSPICDGTSSKRVQDTFVDCERTRLTLDFDAWVLVCGFDINA